MDDEYDLDNMGIAFNARGEDQEEDQVFDDGFKDLERIGGDSGGKLSALEKAQLSLIAECKQYGVKLSKDVIMRNIPNPDMINKKTFALSFVPKDKWSEEVKLNPALKADIIRYQRRYANMK